LRAPRFGVAVLSVCGGAALLVGAAAGAALGGVAGPLLSGPDQVAAVTIPSTAPASPTPTPTRTTPPIPPPTPTPTPTPAAADPDAVDAAGLTVADRAAGLTSLAEPTSASGELVVVPGSAPAPNPAAARVRTVRVEVEAGLDIDPTAFAATVMATLNDPRGWGADGSVSFAWTDGEAQIRVVLASPDKVDAMCAPLNTGGVYSCGRYGHAALNHTRWVSGADEFTDMTQYRHYLVNHEVGHLLGHPHVPCGGAGELAPIMQQQTIAVAPCLANGWPSPEAG